ncbi:beta-1,2-xylosyltransferase XYXT1-like [Rutidosis leptorrhynchoides]|uniref:beta-1,2-xylosyltransferase XYXT1-like n=1 Tax=Rutidosis leptorrhynchoides TaxID=125765 RepID=UPI003A9A49A1
MVMLSASQVDQQIGGQEGKMNIVPLNDSSHNVNYTNSKISAKAPLDHEPTSSIPPILVNHNENRSRSLEPSSKPTHIPASESRNDSFNDPHELLNSIDCTFSEPSSDYCKIEGMVRIDGHTSTIFTTIFARNNESLTIKPYPRKGTGAMDSVRQWTIKPVYDQDMPNCNTTHTEPALIFSTGGFSGNHFHDFSDIIIPLFANSRIFNGKVHLLVTNYKSWWISKFQRLLNSLSDHQVVDIDSQKQIHCYENAIIGHKFYKELTMDSLNPVNGYLMKDFRDFLRSTYSLERREVLQVKSIDNRRPRLMIISRKSTRRITNEASVVKMAKKIGYEVIIANETLTTSRLSSFAKIVNSCDVLMGVHGAGLTNMVFLPDHAVVVQVVPLGGLEGIAKMDFGEPSKEMNLRYLKYSISVKESSLSTQYAADDVVLRDPIVIHKQGWNALKKIYLTEQNVKLDVRKFRSTLLKALKLLHH